VNHTDAYFRRKLYTFLQLTDCPPDRINRLDLWEDELPQLRAWWCKYGQTLQDIARSSDRVGLPEKDNLPDTAETRHLISGQRHTVNTKPAIDWDEFLNDIPNCDPKTAFLWLWRFYPAELAKHNPAALLYPADRTIPDCPHHSYIATVTAIAGAMFPDDRPTDRSQPPDRPYILLFSFSPVQDFIKASRKFLDFWAGSYLLHYLSAKLCWDIAQRWGADTAIVPSLWNQEIIDAFINRDTDFATFLQRYTGSTPQQRFLDDRSDSLVTAGFPNALTLLVSERHAAEIGANLKANITEHWHAIAKKVRLDISKRIRELLPSNEGSETDRNETGQVKTNQKHRHRLEQILKALAAAENLAEDKANNTANPNRRDLDRLSTASNWEWRHLWDAQIKHTWETYWNAIPLGDPATPLYSDGATNWIDRQDAIAPPSPSYNREPTLTDIEARIYGDRVNVGTWWGNVQARARHGLQAIKTDRVWKIPAAPGLRSTLSGQFSALHPFTNYQRLPTKNFREGAGINSGSMRLFWRLMEEAYPGLFNGSEMLNALELTKRMAWAYGGVAEDLLRLDAQDVWEAERKKSIVEILDPDDELRLTEDEASEREDSDDSDTDDLDDAIDYEQLVRFPNLSSIAAARFIREQFETSENLVTKYWVELRQAIVNEREAPKEGEDAERQVLRRIFSKRKRRAFYRKTRRPTQCPNTDRQVDRNPSITQFYNGTMFSSKWLADDMSLDPVSLDSEYKRLQRLRNIVDNTHRKVGLSSGSPSDWWAIVLADGDSMGQYVAGTRLAPYSQYICEDAVDRTNDRTNNRTNIADGDWTHLMARKKRMTPATHVGLNRALLDFSNRLVPYLTEQRYCGRVVYSGGDDVMVVLPLEDLPGFLLSLRAAWCGNPDPGEEFSATTDENGEPTGYWQPRSGQTTLEPRPHFTMGKGATMSAGIVIANKAVPLPTVLDNLWAAEGDRAKSFEGKDGLCFRVAYGNGNVLEALMKGSQLESWWWDFVEPMSAVGAKDNVLSPLLYRLAEELPRRCCFTSDGTDLFAEATRVIANRRETNLPDRVKGGLIEWVRHWERWAIETKTKVAEQFPPETQDIPTPTGCDPEDLGTILRFTAFWLDKMAQRHDWVNPATGGETP